MSRARWRRSRREPRHRHAVDRVERRPWCSSRSASCSRCSIAARPRCRGWCRSTSRCPTFTLTTLDGKTRQRPLARGQDLRRELLELVVHPVPARSSPRSKTFYAEHRNEPDFAMVGIVRDDERRPIRDYVAAERDRLAGRVRPERQRGARFRDDGPARDLRDLARAASPRAAASGRHASPSSRPGSQAARDGGPALEASAWLPWLVLAAVVVIAVRRARRRARGRATRPPRARSGSTNELACPVCAGESVADSNSPESRAIRADIVKRDPRRAARRGDPRRVRRDLRRAHPVDAVERRHRHRGLGRSRSSRSCSAGPGSCSPCGAGARRPGSRPPPRTKTSSTRRDTRRRRRRRLDDRHRSGRARGGT